MYSRRNYYFFYSSDSNNKDLPDAFEIFFFTMVSFIILMSFCLLYVKCADRNNNEPEQPVIDTQNVLIAQIA